MEYIEVVQKRRSARSFSSQPVSDEILMELMEAARLAPSPGNGQSWCFGVIRDAKQRQKLAEAAGNQQWIAEAPVLIACCAILGEDMAMLPEENFGLIVNKTRFGEAFIHYMNSCPDRKMANTFWNNGVPTLAAEHIFLAAVNRGLSACWVGYLDIREASELLGLPEDQVCLFLMPIGYSDEEPEEIRRKSIDEIVFFEKWSEK